MPEALNEQAHEYESYTIQQHDRDSDLRTIIALSVWYNNEESTDGACADRCLTSISIKTSVEMVH